MPSGPAETHLENSPVIAVDAMGGDHAPRIEVEGAVQAARELGVRVILVGREDLLKKELGTHDLGSGRQKLPIEIVHASEAITMDDSAARSFRQKRDSSIRVAARLVREGRAQGLVSAGNTGAVMATVKIVLGVVPGVERPAAAAVFPTARGTRSILLDAGANVDCRPEHLEQFAVMGDIFAQAIFGLDGGPGADGGSRSGGKSGGRRPRVGLLSIGEEQGKGNELTRGAFPLLQRLPLDFAGNVEGRDLYTGAIDVIVCDGFIGNVALKVSEGLADTIKTMLKEELSRTLAAQAGYMLSRRAFHAFRKRIDYNETGGAPLLGVKGVCILTHGSANARALRNGIRMAAEFYRGRINERIEAELAALHARAEHAPRHS